MRTLAMTTSTLRCGVALLDGPSVVARRSVDDDRLHAERIFAMIDECLAEARWMRRALELVACDVGPGSFTGVRVGLASAKGIALGLRIPIVGVGSLEAMACAALPVVAGSTVLAVLDARREERFVAAYSAAGEVLPPAHLPTARLLEFLGELSEDACFCGDDGGVLAPARRVEGLGCDLPDAGVLEPRYVRPPDAKLPTLAPDRRLPR